MKTFFAFMTGLLGGIGIGAFGLSIIFAAIPETREMAWELYENADL